MPWQHCNNWYNTEDCISMEEIKQLKCGQQQPKQQTTMMMDIINQTTTTTQRSILINQSLPLKKLLLSNRKIINSTTAMIMNREQPEQEYDIEMICEKLSNRTSPTEEFFKLVQKKGFLNILKFNFSFAK